ncbi:MAG: 30S ribosomal protein S15 [Deltaproteobacteria bacterium]|nr:30S ribosomal protein S15 [Deltaproteobacteria bacterium]
MVLTNKDKKKIIDKFKIHDKDTGSSKVQIALLTKRINDLTGHFKIHQMILLVILRYILRITTQGEVF